MTTGGFKLKCNQLLLSIIRLVAPDFTYRKALRLTPRVALGYPGYDLETVQPQRGCVIANRFIDGKATKLLGLLSL